MQQIVNIIFTPTDTTNYTIALASVLINVTQEVPTINWSKLANIISGTPLSSNQSDATPSVSETFGYTPLAGTILSVDQHQTLNITFTPNDIVNYTTTSATVWKQTLLLILLRLLKC
jgi:hypothetical protein